MSILLIMVANSSNSAIMAWNGPNFRLDSSDDGLFRVRFEKGDSWYQRPGIRHREVASSEDYEGLEIVAPGELNSSEASE